MPIIFIEIPGKPLARKAHKTGRFVNRTTGKFYSKPLLNDDDAAFQNLCKMSAQRGMGSTQPFSCLLFVFYLWVFPPPMSRLKKAQRAVLDRGALLDYDGPADTDNLLKNTNDGIKHIAFLDDKLVCRQASAKVWGLRPHTMLLLLPLADYLLMEDEVHEICKSLLSSR